MRINIFIFPRKYKELHRERRQVFNQVYNRFSRRPFISDGLLYILVVVL